MIYPLLMQSRAVTLKWAQSVALINLFLCVKLYIYHDFQLLAAPVRRKLSSLPYCSPFNS